MKKKITLSVVTVTYKPDLKELILFINSFFCYNDLGEDAKLVIVDNSPIGFWNSSFIIDKYPSVTIVSNPANPGFGASNNIGFEQFESDYVLFINNDVEFLESVFRKVIAEFRKDVSIGCIGIHQEGGSPSFFCKMTASKGTKTDIFDERVHFISGAFLFFKSSVFNEIGRFDPQLFMYLEEFDLSERLIKHHYRTVYIKNLHFLHKTGHRTKESEFSAKVGTASIVYICKKYGIQYDIKKDGIIRRWKKLLFLNVCLLNFRQVILLYKMIKFRQKYFKENL